MRLLHNAGFTRDGSFATAVIADARFAFPLGEAGSDISLAPLLCAGLIGWRSLVIVGGGNKLGLNGFGAAAHIVAQIARAQARSVFAFTRPGDVANLTRQDGLDFLRLAPGMAIETRTTRYALQDANQALADLRAGRFEGAAVLVP